MADTRHDLWTTGSNCYGRYCIPLASAHRPAARRILAGDVHEPETIRFMIQNHGGSDIVHAGTYFGDFLPALSRNMNPDACLWAFEPNPENHSACEQTIALNALKNVRLANAGLGSKKDSGLVLTRDQQGRSLGGCSRLVDPQEMIAGELTSAVQIVRLDDVVPPYRPVGILQLDVEGSEEAALRGAIGLLRRWRPILILERKPDSHWFEANITPLGYTEAQKLHGNRLFLPQR